jgi:hypothetical protein
MIMMLKEDLIPPQPGMAHPLNKQFPELNKMNVVISDRKRIFKAANNDGKRKMLLNNFDAAVRIVHPFNLSRLTFFIGR